jgi:hypothetical protein
MNCPIGQIKRNSKKKIKNEEKCIKALSQSDKKRSELDKKIMSREKREHTIARKKFGTPKCKKGEIIKEGYHKKASSRNKGMWVALTCIKARGSSKKRGTKGKKLFRLEKGTLSKYGYHNIKKLSKKERRQSLKKAVSDMKPLSVMRKLIAVSTLQKNTDPKMSKIFREDADWVRNTKEYKSQQAK